MRSKMILAFSLLMACSGLALENDFQDALIKFKDANKKLAIGMNMDDVKARLNVPSNQDYKVEYKITEPSGKTCNVSIWIWVEKNPKNLKSWRLIADDVNPFSKYGQGVFITFIDGRLNSHLGSLLSQEIDIIKTLNKKVAKR